MKLIYLFALSFLIQISISAQSKVVLGEEEIRKAPYTKFENRSDKFATPEMKAMEAEIGKGLHDLVIETDKPINYKGFTLQRFYSDEKGKFGGDILVLNKNATYGHINSIKRILNAYIQNSFEYTEKNADVLVMEVLYYNAQNRQKLDRIKKRYTKSLVAALNKNKVGIGKKFNDWPGNTQIVIPIKASVDAKTPTITENKTENKTDEKKEPSTVEKNPVIEREKIKPTKAKIPSSDMSKENITNTSKTVDEKKTPKTDEAIIKEEKKVIENRVIEKEKTISISESDGKQPEKTKDSNSNEAKTVIKKDKADPAKQPAKDKPVADNTKKPTDDKKTAKDTKTVVNDKPAKEEKTIVVEEKKIPIKESVKDAKTTEVTEEKNTPAKEPVKETKAEEPKKEPAKAVVINETKTESTKTVNNDKPVAKEPAKEAKTEEKTVVAKETKKVELVEEKKTPAKEPAKESKTVETVVEKKYPAKEPVKETKAEEPKKEPAKAVVINEAKTESTKTVNNDKPVAKEPAKETKTEEKTVVAKEVKKVEVVEEKKTPAKEPAKETKPVETVVEKKAPAKEPVKETKAEEPKKEPAKVVTPPAKKVEEKLPTTKTEIKKMAQELTELKAKEKDKVENSENVVGEKIVFLKVKEFLAEGHYSSEMWAVDTENDDELFQSPFKKVCGKEFKELGTGVIVMSFKENDIIGTDTHHLALLDKENLKLIKQTPEIIFWRSFVKEQSGKIYAVEFKDGKYYLAQFKEDLTFEMRSSDPINPDCEIAFKKNKIYLTKRSPDNSGVSIRVLNRDNLKLRDVKVK
jgi:hypothetical protein